jgi:hypothetical protein
MSQIHLPGLSLVGRVYIPSSPLPQAAENGIIPFLLSLELEFCLMLEKTRNRGSIASIQKANRDIEADKVKANKAVVEALESVAK